jgi:hypothetical protein
MPVDVPPVLAVYDAAVAAGRAEQLDPVAASAALDELLVDGLAAVLGAHLEGSVHLHCTDVEGEWLVVPGANGVLTVTREHAKGACALRGTAEALLLALWGRTGLDTIDVIGDGHLARQCVAALPLP